MKILLRRIVIAVAAAFQIAAIAATSSADEWRFSVSLDGKAIGYHTFLISEHGRRQELLSEARFNIKILFFNAYRYAHNDRELWRDGCLDQIAANTDDNGVRKIVTGLQDEDHFRLIAGATSTELSRCVLTFAYWNPRILEATHLLNPQTGEYVPVRVQRLGSESLIVRGAPQAAERYRLLGDATVGGKLAIDLWYSQDMKWLALESTTEDGRHLRYQLQ